MIQLDKENMVGIENNDWLHRDDSYQLMQRNEHVVLGIVLILLW
jgi:hypothetical protein